MTPGLERQFPQCVGELKFQRTDPWRRSVADVPLLLKHVDQGFVNINMPIIVDVTQFFETGS